MARIGGGCPRRRFGHPPLLARPAPYRWPVPHDPSPLLVDIRVIPRARRDEVDGERAGRLLVRTAAAPVDGRANAAVCKVLAAHFGVPARCVSVVSGERSRDKTVRIDR